MEKYEIEYKFENGDGEHGACVLRVAELCSGLYECQGGDCLEGHRRGGR